MGLKRSEVRRQGASEDAAPLFGHLLDPSPKEFIPHIIDSSLAERPATARSPVRHREQGESCALSKNIVVMKEIL
ncbi:MAG: hypothetical protein Q9204_005357 [Flavoplaca sp. TL-2023a]